MKKRILAVLVVVLMFGAMIPTTGMAALKDATNDMAYLNFTSFVKNTPNSTNIDGSGSGKTFLRITNAGTAMDYEPVSGLFGKAADDVAVKATRISGSTATSVIGPKSKLTDNGCPVAGNYIDLNWEWAFGDMDVERYVDIKFYNNSGHAWNAVNSFSYTSSGSNIGDVLRISPHGTIRFFGKVLDKSYFFETDTWYNFDIRVKVGTNTVKDAEGNVTNAGTKAVAYLYIDSVLIGEKEINNAADDATTIYNPHCIYRVDFRSAASANEDSSVRRETTYIDNIKSGKYRLAANSHCWPWMHQMDGTPRDYTITSKSDNFITDGLHIALKNPQTVAELKADLSYLQNADTGIAAITIVDALRNTMADDAEVIPGCAIRLQTKSNSETHFWYRKIVDNITYLSNGFESGASYNTADNSTYGFTVGNWWKVAEYSLAYVASPKDYTRAALVNKVASHTSAFDAKYYINYKGTPSWNKYVVEMSVMRDAVSSDYPEVRVVMGEQTVACLRDDAVIGHADNDMWPAIIAKDGKIDNKWWNFALEVDSAQKTAKVYLNGKYTGITRTNVSYSYYKGIGLLIKSVAGDEAIGKSYMDNIKVYSGTYTESEDVTSNNSAIKVTDAETLVSDNELTVADIKDATGADGVYAYADGAFGAEITEGLVPADSVAVYTEDGTDIIRYMEVVYTPVISGVTFDTTSVAGKITAAAKVNNRSSMMYKSNAKLVIASYDVSGANRKLEAVDVYTLSGMKKGEYDLSAQIDYDASKEVKAFIWNSGVMPYAVSADYKAE